MDVTEEEWLTTGQAAKVAARDIRTIRRWSDEGRLRTRVSPGGHRQIALSSLLATQQRPTATTRRRRRGQAAIQPTDTLEQWADAVLDWPGWTPPPTATAGDLQTMIDQLGDIQAALDDLDRTLHQAILDAPQSAATPKTELFNWLESLPDPRRYTKPNPSQ